LAYAYRDVAYGLYKTVLQEYAVLLRQIGDVQGAGPIYRRKNRPEKLRITEHKNLFSERQTDLPFCGEQIRRKEDPTKERSRPPLSCHCASEKT
jgi:hypothetical protein